MKKCRPSVWLNFSSVWFFDHRGLIKPDNLSSEELCPQEMYVELKKKKKESVYIQVTPLPFKGSLAASPYRAKRSMEYSVLGISCTSSTSFTSAPTRIYRATEWKNKKWGRGIQVEVRQQKGNTDLSGSCFGVWRLFFFYSTPGEQAWLSSLLTSENTLVLYNTPALTLPRLTNLFLQPHKPNMCPRCKRCNVN